MYRCVLDTAEACEMMRCFTNNTITSKIFRVCRLIIIVLLVDRQFVCLKALIKTPRRECFYVEDCVLSVYVVFH